MSEETKEAATEAAPQASQPITEQEPATTPQHNPKDWIPKHVYNSDVAKMREQLSSTAQRAKELEDREAKLANDANHWKQLAEEREAANMLMQKQNVAMTAFTKAGVIDPTDMWGHVDLTSLELADGTLSGLEQKLAEKRTTHPHLFKNDNRGANPPLPQADNKGFVEVLGKNQNELMQELLTITDPRERRAFQEAIRKQAGG